MTAEGASMTKANIQSHCFLLASGLPFREKASQSQTPLEKQPFELGEEKW